MLPAAAMLARLRENMASYEFQCEKCATEFEKDLPMGSSIKPKCPACGSARTVRIFSAAGIAFKGSGFYVTDSRGGKSSSSAKTPAAAETPAETTPAADPPAAAPAPTPAEKKSPAKSGGKASKR